MFLDLFVVYCFYVCMQESLSLLKIAIRIKYTIIINNIINIFITIETNSFSCLEDQYVKV